MDLAGILHPIPTAVFLLEHFGKRAVHLPGAPKRFAALLEGLKGSERIDQTHPPARLLAERLERTIEAPVEVHLRTGGEIPHQRSERDLIALQLEGEAKWNVQGTTSYLLAAGDALYVPRDCWYSAEGGGMRTLHVTIHNPTGADLLQWLAQLLKEHERLRSDIPRFAGPGEQADYLAAMRRPMMRALRSPGLLERYARYLRETAARTADPGVSWNADLNPAHLIELDRARRLQVRRLEKGSVYVVSGGAQVAFPDEASQFLQYLDEHAPVSIGQFYQVFAGDFERDELADFLSVLSREGIIVLREPL